MSGYNQLMIDCITAELKLCQEQQINQEQVDFALRQSMGEHFNTIIQCAIAEYYLVRGDYEKAKFHSKKYRKMLKELL